MVLIGLRIILILFLQILQYKVSDGSVIAGESVESVFEAGSYIEQPPNAGIKINTGQQHLVAKDQIAFENL